MTKDQEIYIPDHLKTRKEVATLLKKGSNPADETWAQLMAAFLQDSAQKGSRSLKHRGNRRWKGGPGEEDWCPLERKSNDHHNGEWNNLLFPLPGTTHKVMKTKRQRGRPRRRDRFAWRRTCLRPSLSLRIDLRPQRPAGATAGNRSAGGTDAFAQRILSRCCCSFPFDSFCFFPEASFGSYVLKKSFTADSFAAKQEI